MKDFCIIIPFFKREIITSLCFEHLKNQQEKHNFFDVLVCGSEGKKSQELAEKYNFKYLEFPNNPVSNKNNFLIQNAKEYKGIIILGSDNFLSDETLLNYKKLNLDTFDFYGLKECHFLVINENSEFGVFESKGQSIGAGRLYTQKLLKAINYNLWNVEKNKGLDYIAKNKAEQFGKEIYIDGFVLDVKHELNITNPAIIESCKKIELDKLKDFLSIGEKLLNLKMSNNEKQIKMNVKELKTQKRKVEVEFLKDSNNFKKGQKIIVDSFLARSGVVENLWKITNKQPFGKTEQLNNHIDEKPTSKENLQVEEPKKTVKLKSIKK